jgi:hypothetical protein
MTVFNALHNKGNPKIKPEKSAATMARYVFITMESWRKNVEKNCG